MQDPVESRADESEDLYEVASWEPRTRLDALAVQTYRGVLAAGRAFVVGFGVVVFLLIVGGGAAAFFIDNPFVLGLVVLSIIPAALLVLYVYLADITTREPPALLAVTFVFAVLFAGFAAIVNTSFGFLQSLGLAGVVAFYFLIVGPGEEIVKLLSVRMYAYRDDRFDSVIDGAVYGAVAGLGFATIENAIYITGSLQGSGTVLASEAVSIVGQILKTVDEGSQITAVRSLAGPGHVIYSAFAGYYLGLAKFNPDRAGPIVVKGLLIAAFIHATYNTLVGIVPAVVGYFYPWIPGIVLFFGFVIVYDGIFFLVLYRKLNRYRRAYAAVHDTVEDPGSMTPELTEFDADTDQ